MKSLLLLAGILIGQLSMAMSPPAGYPLVKGIVKKIDLSTSRISIKHEEITNLDMPGMTMVFSVNDPQMLQGLAVNDQITFVADEVNFKITVLWIEKSQSLILGR